jgi:glycosyltransferase involved in cell wall biosynthesis
VGRAALKCSWQNDDVAAAIEPSTPLQSLSSNEVEVSVVMPCLNEAETLAVCIRKALSYFENSGIHGEVVIADNGSTDGSQQIAKENGARVVPVVERGYGSALQGGIAAARGRYVIMGDADDSYDFATLGPFVEKLREGHDLVMGNRFRGGISPGAMPPLHKYLGNPVLTGIGRLFFRSPVADFHCGLRGFSKAAYERMEVRTTGMEFASEMVVKATLLRMRIIEVPTTLQKDGRSRPPHLRSWRDGWRHLRFLLLFSPRWLFLYPGALLMLIGLIAGAWLMPGPRVVAGIGFDAQTLLYAGLAVLIGYQAVIFALFTKMFAMNAGLLPHDTRIERFTKGFNLEGGLIIGTLLIIFGLGMSIFAVSVWSRAAFGELDPSQTLRIIVPAGVALALGCQTILSSFFLSVLSLPRR